MAFAFDKLTVIILFRKTAEEVKSGLIIFGLVRSDPQEEVMLESTIGGLDKPTAMGE